MALTALTFVLAIILAAVPAHGGSQSWESSISYSRVPAFKPATLLMNDNSTTAEGSLSAENNNHKRWVSIKPGTRALGAKLEANIWPNGIIKYCFEDKEWPERDGKTTRQILFRDLETARDLWYNAGLPENKFKWEPMNENDCKNTEKRSQFLLIQFNTEGHLGTIPGSYPSETDNAGPIMDLSDTEERGMLNIVANYAHEMGHAWGLQHEHQNPAFWNIEPPTSDAPFNAANWHCENLEDYESTLRKLKEFWPAGTAASRMKLACTHRSAAWGELFSAVEYLPFSNEEILTGSKRKTGIDWDSIMLYPSGSGGKVEVVDGVQVRKSVLTKPNGDKIPINLKPSLRDVEGLKKLYKYSNPDWTFRPYGDIRSFLRNSFRDVRRKDPDSECQ